jgi:hypothetical protein
MKSLRDFDHRGKPVFDEVFAGDEPFKAGVAKVAIGSSLSPQWKLPTLDGRLF